MPTEILELQKDVAQLTAIVDKMDTTIARVTDLAGEVSKIMAVQSARLEQQERTLDKLVTFIDHRREQVDVKFGVLQDSMNIKVEVFMKELKSLSDKYDDREDKIKSSIVETKSFLQIQVDNLKKYMYMSMGAVGILSLFSDVIMKKLGFS